MVVCPITSAEEQLSDGADAECAWTKLDIALSSSGISLIFIMARQPGDGGGAMVDAEDR